MTEHVVQDRAEAREVLWQQALQHLLAVKAAPQDAQRRRLALHWCEADPAHEAAFREAEKVWSLAGQVQPAYAQAWQAAPLLTARQVSRRLWLAGAAAMAAALAGIVVAGTGVYGRWGAEATATQETRILQLADGSRVTLGPDSAVRVAFTEAVRRVELVDGIAFFEVQPDKARPFTVDAAGVTTTVLGTAFEVKLLQDKVAVSVAEGIVGVDSAPIAGFTAAQLAIGDWMMVDLVSGGIESGHGQAGAVAAWRDGFLVVDNRPIRELAAEIGRWHQGAIFILDDALATPRVSGTLDLRDPEAALQAIIGLYGGRVDRVTPWALFLSGA